MVRLGLYAGLRNEEMGWLQWSAIDWDNRILNVQESVCPLTKETWVPKDYEARRIDVKPACIEFLQAERARQEQKDLLGVFVLPGGKPGSRQQEDRLKPVHPDTPSKSFAKMIRAEEWDTEITVYSLRHTYATMALRAGVDLRTLQKRMGHADIKTTLEPVLSNTLPGLSVVHRYLPNEDPVRIKLIKNTKGYSWELSVAGRDPEAALALLQDLEQKVRETFGDHNPQ